MTFRSFIQLEEKVGQYFAALQDELGIDTDQITKGAQVGSFFKMGKIYNVSPYKILGFEYSSDGKPTYARCQIMNDPAIKISSKFRMMRGDPVRMKSAEPDNKVYLVPIDKLQDIMTRGMDQAAMGGGMGGGGMGMPM